MNSPLAFIFDTSGDTVQAFLAYQETILTERSWPTAPDTGRQLLLTLDHMLAETGLGRADLGLIAVYIGPGRRFSALRSGVVVATTMAQALSLPLVRLLTHDSAEAMLAEAFSAAPATALAIIYE